MLDPVGSCTLGLIPRPGAATPRRRGFIYHPADWDCVKPTGYADSFTLSRADWDCVQPTRGWQYYNPTRGHQLRKGYEWRRCIRTSTTTKF